MTRTDNTDGTWDILFDSEIENIDSLDNSDSRGLFNGYADSVSEYTCVGKITRYDVEIATERQPGKRSATTIIFSTSYRPYIKDGCFVYIVNIDEKPVTASLHMAAIKGVIIKKIEKDILRIADKQNKLLYHYKYGEESQVAFKL